MNYSTELSPGTIVAQRYQIEKTLGQGGFGRTYLVKDTNRFDSYFVLKEFVPRNSNEYVVNKSRELFEREAKVLNRLEHPQIPQFFGWFTENERLFFIQAYIQGQTYSQLLRQRQKQGKVFSETEIVDLLYSLLPVLDYIHKNNIVHRDISPDNIMLCDRKKQPMLIDFGVVTQSAVKEIPNIDPKNSPDTMVGKVGYSPPEQMMQGIFSPNSDLYALGVTILVLLTGKSPVNLFDSATNRWRWRDLLSFKSNLGYALEKMLALNPKDRYESAKQVLDCLSATVVNPVPPPKSISKTPEPSATQVLQPIVAPDTIISSGNNINEIPISPSSTQSSPTSPPIKPVAIAVAAAILLGSGGLVWSQSPKISSLCHKLNNCSPDIKFQEKYDNAIDLAAPTLSKIENPQQIAKLKSQDLQTVRDTLVTTIKDLKTIPNNVKVYPQAQQSIVNFQEQLKQVEAELEKTTGNYQ